MIQVNARYRNADGELTWTSAQLMANDADPMKYLTPFVRANMVLLSVIPASTSPDDRYNPALGTYT